MTRKGIWYPVQRLPQPVEVSKKDSPVAKWRPIQTVGPKNDK